MSEEKKRAPESATKTAIITAILTGIFTVIAGVATYWLTTKEPALSYSVIGGPSLAGPTGAKRIFVVEVRNSGNKEIAQTFIQLTVQGGELNEIASEASPGVALIEEIMQRQVGIRADLLNPNDFVKVSFLTALSSADMEPKVVVRAPGVQAVAESQKRKTFFFRDPANFFALIGAALSAVASTFLMLSKSRLGQKMGMPNIGSIDKPEIAAFICGTCGLFYEADKLRFSASEISFRGIGDYLRHRALQSDPKVRHKYTVALRALLLNSDLASPSYASIRSAIAALESKQMGQDEIDILKKQSVSEGADPVAWRAKIEAFVKTSGL